MTGLGCLCLSAERIQVADVALADEEVVLFDVEQDIEDVGVCALGVEARGISSKP